MYVKKEDAELRMQDYTAGERAYHFARKRLDANGHSVLYHRDAYALFLIERGLAIISSMLSGSFYRLAPWSLFGLLIAIAYAPGGRENAV